MTSLSTYDFLHFILRCHIIKFKTKLKMHCIFKGKVHHTLSVKKETRSLLLNTKVGINFGRIKILEALTYLLNNIFH